MLCYKDITFCASTEHKPDCDRRVTKKLEAEAKELGLPLACAYFCGEPEYEQSGSSCVECGEPTNRVNKKKDFCSSACWQKHRWYKDHGGVGIKCEICGKRFRRVGRHVFNSHAMTAREYRIEFGLDVKRGQLMPDDRENMAEHTRDNGTIENLKNGQKHWFKPGESHNYQRSEQTIARLKKQWAWARELSPANKKKLD